MRLNVDGDRPSRFRRTITFVLFSNNAHSLSTFSLVAVDPFLPALFGSVKICTKVAIFCNFVLDGFLTRRFAIKS